MTVTAALIAAFAFAPWLVAWLLFAITLAATYAAANRLKIQSKLGKILVALFATGLVIILTPGPIAFAGRHLYRNSWLPSSVDDVWHSYYRPYSQVAKLPFFKNLLVPYYMLWVPPSDEPTWRGDPIRYKGAVFGSPLPSRSR